MSSRLTYRLTSITMEQPNTKAQDPTKNDLPTNSYYIKNIPVWKSDNNIMNDYASIYYTEKKLKHYILSGISHSYNKTQENKKSQENEKRHENTQNNIYMRTLAVYLKHLNDDDYGDNHLIDDKLMLEEEFKFCDESLQYQLSNYGELIFAKADNFTKKCLKEHPNKN